VAQGGTIKVISRPSRLASVVLGAIVVAAGCTNSGAATTVYLDVEAYSGTGTADYTCTLTAT